MMNAAASASSKARLAGCLPWACDRTTVRRCRLMVDTQSPLHVSLEGVLRLFPVGVEKLTVLGDAPERAGVPCHLEQPAGAVVVQVDRRRIVEKLLIESDHRARHGCEQIGHGL